MVSGGMASPCSSAPGLRLGLAAERIDIYCDTPSFPCAHSTDAPRMTKAAAADGLAGALAGIAGIPMWFIGSQYEAAPQDEKKVARIPEVRLGAGTASVTFRF